MATETITGKLFYGILPKVRHSTNSEENEKRKRRIGRNGLCKMRVQKTFCRKESGAKSCQSDPASTAAPCGSNWQGRTKTENASNRTDRVPQMREQPSIRMAGADEGRRRIFNAISALHKMQLHIQRILINTVRLRERYLQQS